MTKPEKFERLRAVSMTGLHLGLGVMSMLLMYLALGALDVIEGRGAIIALAVTSFASMGLNLRAAILYGRALKFETALPMQQLGTMGMFVLMLFAASWFLRALAAVPS